MEVGGGKNEGKFGGEEGGRGRGWGVREVGEGGLGKQVSIQPGFRICPETRLGAFPCKYQMYKYLCKRSSRQILCKYPNIWIGATIFEAIHCLVEERWVQISRSALHHNILPSQSFMLWKNILGKIFKYLEISCFAPSGKYHISHKILRPQNSFSQTSSSFELSWTFLENVRRSAYSAALSRMQRKQNVNGNHSWETNYLRQALRI